MGLINSGRATLSLGAMTVGSLAGSTTGKIAGYQTWKNTDPGEFKGHHCHDCGKDFELLYIGGQ